jgi:hypothetical protein
VSLPGKNRFDPSFAITDKGDRPSQLFRDYMRAFDALVVAMAAGGVPNNLVNAANDGAAAAAGVSVGNMYRNGSVLMVRVV